jgi:phthiocerol/phenolphthiocerol synthesis type-I polyketide synthase D
LPGLSVQWGPWADVGLAKDNRPPAFNLLPPSDGLAALTALLRDGRGSAAVVDVLPDQFVRVHTEVAGLPFFQVIATGRSTTAAPGAWCLPETGAELTDGERWTLVDARVRQRVADITGIAADRLPARTPLTGLGLDSLMAVKIKNVLLTDFGVQIPVAVLLKGAGLADISGAVLDALAPARRWPPAEETGPEPEQADPTDAAESRLAARSTRRARAGRRRDGRTGR